VLCWQSAVQGKHLPREMSSENLYGIKIGKEKNSGNNTETNEAQE
jgi:hypothetical protein